jgi:hypothetical protein
MRFTLEGVTPLTTPAGPGFHRRPASLPLIRDSARSCVSPNRWAQ